MNKFIIIGIILIGAGALAAAVLGSLGHFYIQKGRSLAAENSQILILDSISEFQKNILKSHQETMKDPSLGLISKNGIEIKETTGGPYFWVGIISRNAGSTNFELNNTIVLKYRNGRIKKININLLPKNVELWNKAYRALIPYDENVTDLLLNLKGTYTNLRNTSTYKVDHFYQYSVKEKTTTQFLYPDLDSAIKELEKNR